MPQHTGPLSRARDGSVPSTRQANLARVLDVLVRRGPMSRASLASATSVTKATASSLVTDLAARGLVRDGDAPMRGPTGRPGTPVHIRAGRVVAVGAEITAGYIGGAIIDLSGSVLDTASIPLDCAKAGSRETVATLGGLVGTLCSQAPAGSALAGIGVAVPGLVRADRTLLVAPNLGWPPVALGRALDTKLGRLGALIRPVAVDNEANLGAFAQLRFANERGWGSFLYVSAGAGVGAGVVTGGEVFRGAHGFGGELGHLVVEPGGIRCRCGNRGCLETVVGLDQVRRAAGIRATRRGAHPTGPAGDDSLLRLAEKLASGDSRAVGALERAGAALASALSAAVNLFDPEGIVIGGYLAPLVDALRPGMQRLLKDQVLGSRWVETPVLADSLGSSGSLLGAAAVALQPILDDPGAVPNEAPSLVAGDG